MIGLEEQREAGRGCEIVRSQRRRDAETKRRRDEHETETNKRERERVTRVERENKEGGVQTLGKCVSATPHGPPPSPPPPPPLPDLQVMVASVPVTAEEPRVARTAGVYFKAPSRAVDELCD